MKLHGWQRAFILLLLYYVILFLGAVIIMYIEAKGLENAISISNVTEPLEKLLLEEFHLSVNRSSLKRILNLAQRIGVQQRKANGMKWKKEISWRTMYKWRYFTHTTLTTVGFGDIVPDTDGGRIFVIIYSIIGIPINIIVTTQVGFLLSMTLNRLIKRIDYCLFRTHQSQHVELKTSVLLTVMCIGWLSIGARMTLTVMNWSWLEGFYAVFVKFSTIGYGDYTLDFSKVYKYWEVLSWYTNIGLAIVTGIFDSLVQLMNKKAERKIEKEKAKGTTVEMNIGICKRI